MRFELILVSISCSSKTFFVPSISALKSAHQNWFYFFFQIADIQPGEFTHIQKLDMIDDELKRLRDLVKVKKLKTIVDQR